MAVVIKTDKLKASILQDDYEEYVKWAWPLVVPQPCEWNWHMSEICKRVQVKVERRLANLPCLEDLLINISPGSSKSLLTSIMLMGWVWAKDPTIKFICGSFALDLAQDLSRKSRQIIKHPDYIRLFPHVEISDNQDTKTYFTTTRGGYRYAVGVGGNVLGRHADIIVLDDIIDPKIAASEVELEGANRWVSDEVSGRKTDKRTSLTIMIMQRLAQNDPAGIKEQGGAVEILRLPAACDEFPVHPPYLKQYYKKNLMDPKRLPRKFLEKIIAGPRGDYVYASQYGQQPIPPGGGLFKVKQFRIDPQTAPKPIQWCRAWDKAGSTGGGSAWTVGVKMGVDQHGRFLIEDVQRFRLNSFERDEYIKRIAQTDGKNVIIALEQEGGSGGKQSLDFSLRDLRGYRIKTFKPTTKKEQRAEPYSVQVNGGNVWLSTAFWNQQFLEEHKFFPMSTYKDQVDAAAMAFETLTGRATIRIGAMTPSKKYENPSTMEHCVKPTKRQLAVIEGLLNPHAMSKSKWITYVKSLSPAPKPKKVEGQWLQILHI